MYYLLINGEKSGPFTAEEVRQYLQQGAIGYDTQYWQNGMMAWESVETARHLFDAPLAANYYLPQYQQQYQQQYQKPPYQNQPPMNYYQPAPIMVQPVIIGVNKSRVAYILLGLFLGGLGVHNFYAGYSGKGVAQLLLNLFLFWTFIVPIGIGIWVIVEVCTVDRDAYGNRMI